MRSKPYGIKYKTALKNEKDLQVLYTILAYYSLLYHQGNSNKRKEICRSNRFSKNGSSKC